MLYLGEGFKGSSLTGIENSDPILLRFFVTILLNHYNISLKKVRRELHLRADQNPKKIKRYWSKELGIPLSNFLGTSIDKRTAGSTTYPTYKGVCVVRCGNVAMQRKLMYISSKFCQKIINQWAVSSVGRASA